ncbi:MAG: subclass B1 metallo-beta-lactamase [Flavobacteriales bacterium]
MRIFTLSILIMMSSHSFARGRDTIHVHNDLKVVPLTKNSYLHISYIPYNGSMIACNGLVYVNQGRALVFDSPVTDSGSYYLINWITEVLGATIDGLVVNHFHEDCLGGMDMFFEYGCMTFSQQRCCALAKSTGYRCTQRYFEDTLTIRVGEAEVECWYPGAAHTQDNIVSYIPDQRILFGGCMVKAMGAGYGNVSDADTKAWPQTLANVRQRYPKVKLVIPGHGNPGSKKLLNYTIDLFESYRP